MLVLYIQKENYQRSVSPYQQSSLLLIQFDMSIIYCSVVQPRYRSVIDALEESGITYKENNNRAILIWNDSIKDTDYFSILKPWQVVNRIPCVNVLCRKASFARLIQKISEYYPTLYSFVPKTYILPFKNSDFMRALKRKKTTWIVKPDSGSLGHGITIVTPGSEYSPDATLSVAQEYLQAFPIDNTKFDLRIYVLIQSVDPLRVYVYRDGLARFCSEQEGQHDIFSQITNVTLNKESPEFAEFEQISRLISDTFERLEKEYLVDTKKLWKEIDNVIILSILSAYKFLQTGVRRDCQNVIYPRCFQILGFDILLDNDMKPHVLEINYRPSLDTHRGPERRMKVSMLRDAINIACPLQDIQDIYLTRKYEWDTVGWLEFVQSHQELSKIIELKRDIAASIGNFELIYPSSDPNLQTTYSNVMKTVLSLKADFLPGSKPEPKDDSLP